MTVVVVSTGGTIAMRPDPATGLVPAVSGEEFIDLAGPKARVLLQLALAAGAAPATALAAEAG